MRQERNRGKGAKKGTPLGMRCALTFGGNGTCLVPRTIEMITMVALFEL